MPSARNIEKQPVIFMRIKTAVACTLLLPACVSTASSTPAQRIDTRSFPSVFQAWNPIDHPDWPQEQLDDRLKAAAKHDVFWEEPISQLGFGTALAIGAVWDGENPGLATDFTPESKQLALANRTRMLELNPQMVFLLEVRWRDAPSSFLPENSPFWKRNPDGSRAEGWDGGPEPYYLLDPDVPEFAANIARQTKIAIDSGIYDGVMLDWSGHLPIVKEVREVIGDDGLIIVNIHDDIEDGMKYQELINGSFMECNPQGPGQYIDPRKNRQTYGTTWDKMREAYLWFEANLRQPRVNCLEVWTADRKDLRRVRAATTLALTHGNGSVLVADGNPVPTPDHLHDWYPIWDLPLGKPKSVRSGDPKSIVTRDFDGGLVAYNHFGNGVKTLELPAPVKRHSTGETGTRFEIQDADGDVFLPLE
jgi:hypothetical protein